MSSGLQTLSFFADRDSDDSHVQVYVSDDGTGNIPNQLPASEAIRYERAARGVWQATIPLDEGPAKTDALYQLFYYFGFGVVL